MDAWEDRDRVLASARPPEDRGAGPGEEGKRAASVRDGTAGGLGAAALTGEALDMQGGGE